MKPPDASSIAEVARRSAGKRPSRLAPGRIMNRVSTTFGATAKALAGLILSADDRYFGDGSFGATITLNSAE
jgi:hypothetical protein